jgi:tetratricopeptide (TPR) repeat protein
LLREGKLFHPLITQVIQEDIPARERTVYAERALLALGRAGLEPTALLISSAQLGKNKTLQIYERLANEAKTKNDMTRAGHWLALAFEQDEARLCLALEAAHLLRHSDKGRALELAQQVAHRPPHQPEAVYLCAELWVEQGNIAEAEARLALLHPQERMTQRWWETLIRIHYTTHADYAEVLRLWESRPELHVVASPEIVVYVCAVLGQRGQFEAAFALSQRLLKEQNLEPYLRGRLLEMQATFYHLQGQGEKAASQNAAALAIAHTLGRPSYLAHLLRKEGIYAENQNRFAYMTACYREALHLLREHGSPLDRANLEAILASSLADQGEYEEAENLLHNALSVLEQSENKLAHCDCRVGLALLYLDWQPRYAKTMALRHATLALELAQGLGNQQMLHSGLTTLALAEAFAGNGQRSLELALTSFDEQYTASSEVRKARSLYALGLALEAKGEKGEAIVKLAESVQRHHALGFTATAHRFGLELDRITHNPDKAAERRAWFESQGLLGGAKIASRYFPLEAINELAPGSTRLCLLGPAVLEREGETMPYRGRKRLELLAYLLETRIAGKSEATFLELTDALYPDADELGAKAILKQLVYLLRNQLGHQAILSTASGYALGTLETDVEQFLKTGESCLLRGTYLEALGEGWYPEVREQLIDKFKELAPLGLESNPTEILRLSEIWQEMEPYDAEALTMSLRALHVLRDERKVKRLYQQAVTRFKEVGELLPETSAAFLQDFVTEM